MVLKIDWELGKSGDHRLWMICRCKSAFGMMLWLGEARGAPYGPPRLQQRTGIITSGISTKVLSTGTWIIWPRHSLRAVQSTMQDCNFCNAVFRARSRCTQEANFMRRKPAQESRNLH